MALPAYRRVLRDDFSSRWWPRHDVTRVALPPPVTPIRFWAPLWLFILGTGSLSSRRRVGFPARPSANRPGRLRLFQCLRSFNLGRSRLGRRPARRSLARRSLARRSRLGRSLARRSLARRSLARRSLARRSLARRSLAGFMRVCLRRCRRGRLMRLWLVGRGDADVHRLALEQRRPLDDAVFLDLIRELVQ